MSRIHFESQLERWAYSAWTRLDLKPPADLAAVSEFLKIHVEYRPMARELHGCYFRLPDGSKVIRINSSLPQARQRFVWAHELGHALLTHSRPGELAIELYANAKGHDEKACDKFAVNLLMPELIVRQLCHDLGHPERVDKTRTLAEKFGVSRQAMQIRLQNLDLAYVPPAR